MKTYFFILCCFFIAPLWSQSTTATPVDGYRGIWFELNQKYTYGDKYSGALATYTAKHTPLAVYAPEVKKTFFVYGGTRTEDERYLLCMIGVFDHQTGMVSRPRVVYDKKGVDDPHDNPSLLIDPAGHIWVFVSGRGTNRPGFKFRSTHPYSIESFVQISEEEMTYPQPHSLESGLLHFFTKYTGKRQLYFETSANGTSWTEDQALAAIREEGAAYAGHYQTSGVYNRRKVGTFFNRHPDGNVDKRTDLYYLQSEDLGNTWTTGDQTQVSLPLVDVDHPARVINYTDREKNVYLKDMNFDESGHPACLYLRSNGHEPGPASAPYEWCLTRWTGKRWRTSVITTSDHNYDMGSLYYDNNRWQVVAPTEAGPQEWGVGGELVVWTSNKRGTKWRRKKILTQNSPLNHSYVRRPLNYSSPFCFFWSDGHAHNFSKSSLYFGDFSGNVWRLPYTMDGEREQPVKVY